MKPEIGLVVQNVDGPFPAGPPRVISLRRRGNAPLGFSIRGGWEHGTGIFVSEVQPVSEAHRQGLRAGDQIIRVNGFSIQRAIHQEVLSLLKMKPGVVLTVKRVGIIPVKENGSDHLTWKIIDPGSSPTSSILERSNSLSSSSSHSDSAQETKIYIPDCETSGLGCSVVNGPPELPGIFISSIKPSGQADQAGLQIGDQIVSANGFSFFNVKFSEVISLLKSFKELHLMVKKQAGLELFGEQVIREVVNGTVNSKNCNHESSKQSEKVNGYTLSNGVMRTNSNGTEQNGCSCESEKDFSLTEVEEEAQWTSSTDYFRRQNGLLPRARRKSIPAEDPRLMEEKRKLEAEQKRLEEEKEKLEEDRKRSTEERREMVQVSPERFMKLSFLSELQRTAEKVSSKGKLNLDENGTQIIENPKLQEEEMKRQQHEMLMEEIHVAHRKMFGSRKSSMDSSNTSNSTNTSTSELSESERSTEGNCIAKKKIPVPPPKPNSTLTKSGSLPALNPNQLQNGTETVNSHKEMWNGKIKAGKAKSQPPDTPTKKIPNSTTKSVHFATIANGESKNSNHVKLFSSSNLRRQKHVTTRRKSCDSQQPTFKVTFDNKSNNSSLHQDDSVKTYTFLKNGPLNLRMEGGIYSPLDGAIVVGELWEGGFIPLDGRIAVGDQILMFDDTNLENVSLTFASAALRDAMNSSKEDLTIVVKKTFKEITTNPNGEP